MATKTLTIMDDAYEMLKAAKKPGESFTDVIRREVGKKRKDSLMKLWGSLSDESAKSIKDTIRKTREFSDKRWKKYDLS